GLHRLLAHAEQHAGLTAGEAFLQAEQQLDRLARRDARERAPDVIDLPVEHLAVIALRSGERDHREDAPAAKMRQREVRGDAEEPRAHRAGIRELRLAPYRANERVLHQIGGRLVVAHQTGHEARALARMRVVERAPIQRDLVGCPQEDFDTRHSRPLPRPRRPGSAHGPAVAANAISMRMSSSTLATCGMLSGFGIAKSAQVNEVAAVARRSVAARCNVASSRTGFVTSRIVRSPTTAKVQSPLAGSGVGRPTVFDGVNLAVG